MERRQCLQCYKQGEDLGYPLVATADDQTKDQIPAESEHHLIKKVCHLLKPFGVSAHTVFLRPIISQSHAPLERVRRVENQKRVNYSHKDAWQRYSTQKKLPFGGLFYASRWDHTGDNCPRKHTIGKRNLGDG